MKRALALLIWAGILTIGMPAAQAQRLASRLGEAVLNGERVFVHVTVAVPRGADANAVTEDSLRGQGARPLQSAEFKTTGLDWDLVGSVPADGFAVTQMYIPTGEPPVDGWGSLTRSQKSWNDIDKSRFNFAATLATEAADLGRCPSLVKECDGPQTFDQKSDVGWVALSGCCTLGVTWYSTGRAEADMALNTKFNWSTTETTPAGYFDLETVMLHENGHVLGLDHSTVPEAVMEATYATKRRDLKIDDQRGDIFLYPAVGATGSISGMVIKKDGTISDSIAGALVTVADLPVSATTDSNGNFSLSGIPKLGTYTLKVSKTGYKSASVENLSVDINITGVIVSLEASTTKGGRPR